MNDTVPHDLVAKLYEPLPPEAITAHPTKSYLSTIKTIYQVERLNQVFGIGGWKAKSEVVEQNTSDGKSPGMIVMKVTLYVPAYGIELEQYGGNDNIDRGDAYKGAYTDALSKICGYLGIGMDVYKGDGPTKANPRPRGHTPAQQAIVNQRMKEFSREPVYEPIAQEPSPAWDDTAGLQPPHDQELRDSIAAIPSPKLIPKKRTAKQIAVLQEFGPLHDRYTKLKMEPRYYEILGSHGVCKSTEFNADTEEGYAQAMRCCKEMKIDVAEMETFVKEQKEKGHA